MSAAQVRIEEQSTARDDLRARFNECVGRASIAAAVWVDRWLVEASDEELEGWQMLAKGKGFQLRRSGGWRWKYTEDVVDIAVREPTLFYKRTVVKSLMRDSRGDACVFAEISMFPPHELIDCGVDYW